jgi:hypothetical protein
VQRDFVSKLWQLSQEDRESAIWSNLGWLRLLLDEVEERLAQYPDQDSRMEAFYLERLRLDLFYHVLLQDKSQMGSPTTFGHWTPKTRPEIESKAMIASLRLALDNMSDDANSGIHVMCVEPYFKGLIRMSAAEVKEISESDACGFSDYAEVIGNPVLWYRLAKYLRKTVPALFSPDRLLSVMRGSGQ